MKMFIIMEKGVIIKSPSDQAWHVKIHENLIKFN